MPAKKKVIKFNPEAELNCNSPTSEELEETIYEAFEKLPKDRQKVVLGELWSEYKPEKPQGLRNFNNIPY